MERDLRAQINSGELAISVNLSTSRLRHLFKREKSMTLAQYQRARRMEEARTLLSSTFLSIKEVMTQVGINSDSHFAHDFKSVFGLTPTEYRANRNRLADLD
jgi:AraC-like DNA-binding protein